MSMENMNEEMSDGIEIQEGKMEGEQDNQAVSHKGFVQMEDGSLVSQEDSLTWDKE